jgi:NAD+ synthase
MDVLLEGGLELLAIDPEAVSARITEAIREQALNQLKRRGIVVGISGGIDSSVVAALCVRAFGPSRVIGLLMPEVDSCSDSTRLGQLLADTLGIRTYVEDIGSILKGARCYERRDAAIRSVIPQYGPDWKCKIVLPDLLNKPGYALFSVVVQAPDGAVTRARLTAEAYLGIVAATNFKQRTRKMVEYYYADQFNYAVAGTPNRLEYDQGFFVKNGDGAADLKPIAHLYKSQVYQLGEYLGIPEEIQQRPPTTDTYSLDQSQEEFYFAVPYGQMDLCLYGRNHDLPPAEIASKIGLTPEQVERIYKLIDAKRAATRYLHLAPLLVPDGDGLAA